jgi:hypothetical protein
MRPSRTTMHCELGCAGHVVRRLHQADVVALGVARLQIATVESSQKSKIKGQVPPPSPPATPTTPATPATPASPGG